MNSRGRSVPSWGGDATHTEFGCDQEAVLMRWEGWESRSWSVLGVGHYLLPKLEEARDAFKKLH